MIQKTITFQFNHKPQRSVAGWFLQGENPSDWLEEICRWDVSHIDLRFLPVPQSKTNRQPMGVLIRAEEESLQQVCKNGLPYGLVESCLFLPVEATVQPHVTKQEWSQLLSDEYIYVWHPASGLIALDAKEELSIADLLTASSTEENKWNHAIPGMAISSRLRSLVLIHPPDLASLFGAEQKEIGSEAKDIDQLPKNPDESMLSGMSHLLGYPAKWLAKGLLWGTSHSPATSDKETWINSVEKFAMRLLGPMNSFNQSNRDREINRLLHLLETDPDKGLRFALPMGGEGNHRGRAPASDWLSQQNVDFSLGNMQGGYAADAWDISYENQMKLLEQYRELANREIQLGRHRRAAYIFAHLLGDNHAAVQTLVAGHQWRDAAILYQEKLNQPKEAAQCLEQGGLWTEAIALYEELENFEKIGDIQRELNRPEEATAAYRTAVEKIHSNDCYVEAARILEEKLNATDEAIMELEVGLYDTSQTKECMENLFDLLAVHGRHEHAIARIEDMQERNLPLSNKILLAEFLTKTTADYPDRNVRTTAENSTRVVVSRNIDRANSQQKRQLLNSLQKLVPADKLLLRDTQRFLKQVKQVHPSVARPSGKDPFLVRTIRFLPSGQWGKAVSDGTSIYVTRYIQQILMVRRARWDGVIDDHIIKWKVEPDVEKSPILLLPDYQPHGHLLTHIIGSGTVLQGKSFTRDDDFANAVGLSGLVGMSPQVVGAANGIDGSTWLLEIRNNELTVIAMSRQGSLLSTNVIPLHNVPPFSETSFIYPLPMVMRCGKIYIAMGSRLVIINVQQKLRFEEYHRQITSMITSAPNTPLRIALTFDQGGILLWNNSGEVTSCSFAYDMDNLVVCFNRKGYLFVAGSGRCEVYKTEHSKLEIIANFPLQSAGNPIAIMASHDQNQFGLFNADGELSVFQIK